MKKHKNFIKLNYGPYAVAHFLGR